MAPGLQRVTDPEILAVELWDTRLNGAVLWDWRHDREFGAALRSALQLWHAGTGVSKSQGALPPLVAGFDAVFVMGGGVQDELRSAMVGLPCPLLFGEGAFAAERGGFELLQRIGLSGWVADWGQSQLKLSAPGARWIFRRDWKRLPMPGDVPLSQLPAQRRRLREFIAHALGNATAEARHQPAALVFAFAGGVSQEGVPEGNTYVGLHDDDTLLTDALQLAGLPCLPLLVLNDAELAALSARLDSRLAAYRKILVLTLGFGIGGALILRPEAP
jgi:hypothetical protein